MSRFFQQLSTFFHVTWGVASTTAVPGKDPGELQWCQVRYPCQDVQRGACLKPYYFMTSPDEDGPFASIWFYLLVVSCICLLVCLRLSICWSTSSTYEWTIASIYFLFVYLFVCLSLLVYLSLCLFTWLSKCHCINSKYQEQDRTLPNLCREYCANSHQCVRRVRVTC